MRFVEHGESIPIKMSAFPIRLKLLSCGKAPRNFPRLFVGRRNNPYSISVASMILTGLASLLLSPSMGNANNLF